MTLAQLIEKFVSKPHYIRKGSGHISKRFNVSPETIIEARKQAKEILKGKGVAWRDGGNQKPPNETQRPSEEKDRSVKVNNEKGTLESSVESTFEPKNDQELAELHHVDLNKYKISVYWSKLKSNGKFTSSILCSLKKPTDFSLEDFAEFLKEYKSSYQPVKSIANDFSLNAKDTVDVEISLADFHLDKLDVKIESVEYKMEMYMRVLQNLIYTCDKAYNINRIVFVLGNDIFQTDTITSTTTSGTIVDSSITWNKAYELGFDLMVKAISLVKEFSKRVDVILVQGNHDRTKEYYLAHGLAVYFRNESSIIFNREFTTVKHIVLGNTFVGYHHGNTRIDDLPLLFATSPESSAAFGNAKYRHITTGDKHYYLTKEIKGVRVQQMPSLSGTDAWHRDNNFVNSIRAGLALVYHPEKGKIAEFEERI